MHRRFLLLPVKLCTFMYMLKGGRQPNLRLGLEIDIYCLGTSSTLIICQLVFFSDTFSVTGKIMITLGLYVNSTFFYHKRMWSFSALWLLLSDRRSQ